QFPRQATSVGSSDGSPLLMAFAVHASLHASSFPAAMRLAAEHFCAGVGRVAAPVFSAAMVENRTTPNTTLTDRSTFGDAMHALLTGPSPRPTRAPSHTSDPFVYEENGPRRRAISKRGAK